jgi:hypothetical protein
MPDRYGEEIERQADIDSCNLCDQHGNRRGLPCDHIDHSAAAQRGIALIRAQMGWKTTKPEPNQTSTPHRQNP